MYEKVTKCPICKTTSFQNFIICKDHTVSGESFALSKCENCGFIFTNPRPDESLIEKYYQSDNYISHSDQSRSITDSLYKIVRSFTLRSKLNLLNSLCTDKTLLDYGCGTGDFLQHCQSKGWAVAGVEPNEKARNISREKLSGSLVRDIAQLDKKNSFDIITLWHVLEHVHDINSLTKTLKERLNKNGYLIIALPNHESYDQNLYQEHWAAYDVPRHLHHFSQQTFSELITHHALKLVNIQPMKFDSYYVSLLSEKYKHGKSNYIKSFINGWKSNRWASKNNNNYSSLIYILKKK